MVENTQTNQLQKDIAALQSIVQGGNNIVFFGGAGVSTESGIPDFRSQDGLYNIRYAYPPETIISASFYKANKQEFFAFYKDKMLYLQARPNAAHIALARLEAAGKLRCVITQNIDGLHQKAGSNHVLELHGSVHRNYCERCGTPYPAEFIVASPGVPQCTCGGAIKPDVVLYEESLDAGTTARATEAIKNADILLVGGTSLAVYPAAGFIQYFRGRHLVVINKTPTQADRLATLVIRSPIGQVMQGLQV